MTGAPPLTDGAVIAWLQEARRLDAETGTGTGHRSAREVAWGLHKRKLNVRKRLERLAHERCIERHELCNGLFWRALPSGAVPVAPSILIEDAQDRVRKGLGLTPIELKAFMARVFPGGV